MWYGNERKNKHYSTVMTCIDVASAFMQAQTKALSCGIGDSYFGIEKLDLNKPRHLATLVHPEITVDTTSEISYEQAVAMVQKQGATIQ